MTVKWRCDTFNIETDEQLKQLEGFLDGLSSGGHEVVNISQVGKNRDKVLIIAVRADTNQ